MNRPGIAATTTLSELQKLARGTARPAGSDDGLVRSIEQSMRVEGYPVSELAVRDAAARMLGRSMRSSR